MTIYYESVSPKGRNLRALTFTQDLIGRWAIPQTANGARRTEENKVRIGKYKNWNVLWVAILDGLVFLGFWNLVSFDLL